MLCFGLVKEQEQRGVMREQDKRVSGQLREERPHRADAGKTNRLFTQRRLAERLAKGREMGQNADQ